MQGENAMTQAAPATLDQVPADAVAVVAAFADFFDRAKLAVCSKHLSRACATVKSELLIVGKPYRDEFYIADDSQWRRCADPPSRFWNNNHSVSIDGRYCMVSDEREKTGPHTCRHHYAAVYLYDPRRNEWSSQGTVKELKDSRYYGCCAFDGSLVFVSGEDEDGDKPFGQRRSMVPRVLKVDPETLASEPMVSLPLPRNYAVCGVADGKLFVLGGYCKTYGYREEPDPLFMEEEATVRVLVQQDGQEDVWSAFAELPPALRPAKYVQNPFRTNVSFRGHRIFVIGNNKDYTVRVLDVRTKVWSIVEDTTLKAHWRRPRSSEYGFPEDLEDEDEWLEGGMMIEFLSTADRPGNPHCRNPFKGPASMPVICYRGDFAVIDDGGDADEGAEEEDMDRPGIYVLTSGNTWIQTGGRLGCSASREDQYDLFPEDVEVAAPPAWLQNMPVRLTRPWYSTWSTDRSVADADADDYQRYANKLSHICPGRFCVVTAASAPPPADDPLRSEVMAVLEQVRLKAPEKYGPLLERLVAESAAALAQVQLEKGL